MAPYTVLDVCTSNNTAVLGRIRLRAVITYFYGILCGYTSALDLSPIK